MKIRTVSLLATVALGGLAVAAFAQGVFDPSSPPPLPESGAEATNDEGPASEEPASEIEFYSEEVVQPIDDTPGPAARTIEPPVAEEWVEAEPAAAPVSRGKLVRIQRVAQASAPDKRIRITK